MGSATGRSHIGAVLALVAWPIAAQTVSPQQAGPSFAPQIVVSGTADILLPAAKASFSIGVTTSAPGPASASEENARVSKGVTDALQRAGLRREEIMGSRLVVSPRWNYSGQRPKRMGFEATNTFEIETENLAQMGIYIDTALSAGATDTSQFTFSAKDTDSARREALSQAVQAARTDAEAMARAGGGTLGELLLLSTERSRGVGLSEAFAAAAPRAGRQSVNTEVIPGQIKVSATVEARWRFIPAVMVK